MDWLWQEFIKQPIPVIIAIIGVLSAVLTALVALIGIRSNSQALAAKDAQIESLKTRIDDLGAFDARNFLAQHQSQIELYEQQSSRLKSEVKDLIGKLRAVEGAVTDEQRAMAHLMGVGRVLGITDSELILRRIAGLVKKRGFREFGDAEPEVFELYLDVMQLIFPDEQAAREIAKAAPEYILDEAIIPLLGVSKLHHLKERAFAMAELIADSMTGTPLEWEVDIYREAIAAAKESYDFTSGNLPPDLAARMIQGKPPT